MLCLCCHGGAALLAEVTKTRALLLIGDSRGKQLIKRRVPVRGVEGCESSQNFWVEPPSPRDITTELESRLCRHHDKDLARTDSMQVFMLDRVLKTMDHERAELSNSVPEVLLLDMQNDVVHVKQDEDTLYVLLRAT